MDHPLNSSNRAISLSNQSGNVYLYSDNLREMICGLRVNIGDSPIPWSTLAINCR
jgi:hypothetical protein